MWRAKVLTLCLTTFKNPHLAFRGPSTPTVRHLRIQPMSGQVALSSLWEERHLQVDLCSSNPRCSRPAIHRVRKNFALKYMVLERPMQCSLSLPGWQRHQSLLHRWGRRLHTSDRRLFDADPNHHLLPRHVLLTMKIKSTPVHQYFFRILKHKYQESQVHILVQVLFSFLPTRMMRSS